MLVVAGVSDVKLARRFVVDPDEICEKYYAYRNKYDRSIHFCVDNSMAPCKFDGPIMGIDNSDPDTPYWYLFGVFGVGPSDCVEYPKLNMQIYFELSWIKSVIEM